ncbi:MAG: hypothetical protein BGO69_19785 [Bacteroidetes bacterium 46-16]|nr:MAG: hypothetical protein BGO69_19785 [Bacteroidetes bacterium 46-16]
MKKILFIACTIAAVAVIFSACKKTEKFGKRFETLRNHTWHLESQTINGADQPLNDCEAGNYWVFKGDEYGYEANVTCGDTQVVVGDTTSNNGGDSTIKRPQGKASATPTQIDFTWSVTGDQRYVYIKDFGTPGNDIDWLIVSMDETKFHVQGRYTVNEVNYFYDKYFVAQ